MPRTVPRMVLGVLALAATLTGRVQAQSPTQGANPLTNPYMNPYMNPYLNPSMTTGTVSRNDALLYLYSAQQMPGGLLGARQPAATASTPSAPRTVAARTAGVRTGVAEMPRSVMQPGAGAARYFNRGPVSGPAATLPGAKFMRHERYFSSNGR